jgi:hypothetical protein
MAPSSDMAINELSEFPLPPRLFLSGDACRFNKLRGDDDPYSPRDYIKNSKQHTLPSTDDNQLTCNQQFKLQIAADG